MHARALRATERRDTVLEQNLSAVDRAIWLPIDYFADIGPVFALK